MDVDIHRIGKSHGFEGNSQEVEEVGKMTPFWNGVVGMGHWTYGCRCYCLSCNKSLFKGY